MNRLERLIEQSMEWTHATNASELLHSASPVLETLFQADGGFFLYAHQDGEQLHVRVHQPFGLNAGHESSLEKEITQGKWFHLLPHIIPLSVWTPISAFPESWQAYAAELGITYAGVWPLQVHERVAGAVILGRKDAPHHVSRENRIVQLTVQQVSIVLSLIVDRELAELSSLSDPLTSLPNRRGFTAQWPIWRMGREKLEEKICIGILDIDRFKTINDTQGHWIGDQVLQELAAKLSEAVGPQGLCARWGGDEFVFAISGSDAAEVTQSSVTAKLERSLPEVSFGMAVYTGNGNSFDETLMIADDRMYQAKTKRARADHKVRRQTRYQGRRDERADSVK